MLFAPFNAVSHMKVSWLHNYGVTGLIESPLQILPSLQWLSLVPFTSTIMIRQRFHHYYSAMWVCCAGTNHTHNYLLLHTAISHLYTACTSQAEARPSCTHRGGSGVKYVLRFVPLQQQSNPHPLPLSFSSLPPYLPDRSHAPCRSPPSLTSCSTPSSPPQAGDAVSSAVRRTGGR